MDILKSKCLILKKKDLNEADLLTVVFSKDFGKISGVAFGIRKSKKRNLITLNPLNIAEITFYKKNGYYTIVETELIKNFSNIMKNIEKLEISLYILDSVNKIYDIKKNEIENIYYSNFENFKKIDQFHLEEIFDFINRLEKLKMAYKYYIVLTFLRRIMLEQGIYDTDEINRELGLEFSQIYREIAILHKENAGDIEKIQEKMEQYHYSLRKIVEIFENYINKNLQVKIEIKKFIVEDL